MYNESLELFHLATLKLYTQWTTTTHLCLSSFWQPSFYFLFLWICLLQILDWNHIVFVFMNEWLISLIIMPSGFIHVVARVRFFFPFCANITLHVYATFCLSIHPLIDTLLAIVSSAAVNVGMQIPLWAPAFNSLGYIIRSGHNPGL